MKAKEYLKFFMEKHGLSRGEIWEQHELLKLMNEYNYHSKLKKKHANKGKLVCEMKGKGVCPHELENGECNAEYGLCVNQLYE